VPFLNDLIIKVVKRGEYELTEVFRYEDYKSGGVINIPIGFRTDFASIPRVLRWFVVGHGTTRKPATLHDYLYRETSVSRKSADDLFRQAMQEEGVSFWRCRAMYWAVRVFGGLARAF